MENFIIGIISLAFLGMFAGTMSGLLGIGGGMIIIPGLTIILKLFDIPDGLIMHFAIGTSLCIMICTALSNVISHQKQKHIVWPIFKILLPWVLVGIITGAVISNFINSRILSIIFGIFLLLIAVKTFTGLKPEEGKNCKLQRKLFIPVGTIIGLKSGILGVGGGALSVPFLFYCGFKSKQAVGTSASLTLPIAIAGSIISLISIHHEYHIHYCTGYIFWPGFIVISIFSVSFVPLGVKLVRKLPGDVTRKLFACLLLILSAKMIF